MSNLNQYELYTTALAPNDMPYQIQATSWDAAMKYARRKLRRGEKIISLKRDYLPRRLFKKESADVKFALRARTGKMKNYNSTKDVVYDATCNECGTDFDVSEKDAGKPPFTTSCPNCGMGVDVN